MCCNNADNSNAADHNNSNNKNNNITKAVKSHDQSSKATKALTVVIENQTERLDLTRFNKIAIRGTPQMAVD